MCSDLIGILSDKLDPPDSADRIEQSMKRVVSTASLFALFNIEKFESLDRSSTLSNGRPESTGNDRNRRTLVLAHRRSTHSYV